MGSPLPSLQLPSLALSVPNPGPSTLVYSGTHLIGASGRCLHVIDHDFSLLETLPFELAFSFHRDWISAVAVDPTSGLVAACSGARVGIWELTASGRGWRVHSSFSTGGGRIAGLDFANGRVVTTGADKESVVLWELSAGAFPSWKKVGWEGESMPSAVLRLSPSAGILACVKQASNVVRLLGINSTSKGNALKFRCNAWHALALRDVRWRPSDDAADSGPILFTITLDGNFHIWGCMIDEPEFFSLWATLDVHTFLPSHLALATCYRRTLKQNEGERPGSKDEFVTVFEDGSVWITTVSNLDCRPPSCLSQSSVLLHDKVFAATDLANLRYPLLMNHLTLVARSSRGSLLSVDLSVSNPSPITVPVNFTGVIKNLLPTFLGDSLLVIGEGKVQHWEVGEDDEIVETFATEASFTPDTKVATWHDGRMFVAATPTILRVFQLRQTRLRLVATLAISTPTLSTLVVARTSEDSLWTTIIGLHASDVYCWTYNSAALSLSHGSTTDLGGTGRTFPILLTVPKQVDSVGLLRVDEEGTLVFWEAAIPASVYTWKKVRSVRTGRRKVRKAAVSIDSLTAIVSGQELSIWDSKESEFASGEQHSQPCDPNVVDVHWSPSGLVLALASLSEVRLLCAQRLDDLSGRPAWITFVRVHVVQLTSAPITAVCWLADGLVVASGQSIVFHSARLVTGEDCHKLAEEKIGPLPYHHPQFLFQSLLHGRTEAVIKVLVGLAAQLTDTGDLTPIKTSRSGIRVRMEDFLARSGANIISGSVTPVDIFSALTKDATRQSNGYRKPFLTEDDVHRLLAALKKCSLRGLTALEHAHLAIVVQTVFDVQRQQGALDANGMRYLISMRSFFLYSAEPSSAPAISMDPQRAEPSERRLKYRDAVWAFHSENQDLLVAESVKACANKICWREAKALSLFLWIKSSELMSTQMEAIGRGEYMKPEQDEKDPVTASLFYLALKKKHMVTTLWKQAGGHTDQRSMVKLLANDFELPRWKSAALKNAFVLLSKQRFLFAAVFFLLADSLKDAVNVCLRQLDDFQLAIAISRVYEGDEGPVFKSILEGTILPLAFKQGFRWLASWAFWMLNRRDLAIETIITPLADLANKLPYPLVVVGRPPHEDPCLVLLFAQLRSWSLQTLKGATAVPGHTEFNFVLHMSRVLTRMGCHVLALNLVQSWEFAVPARVPRIQSGLPSTGVFMPRGALRRKSTFLDLEIPSQLPSRSASPERTGGVQFHKILKETKVQTQVPEFDMGAFF